VAHFVGAGPALIRIFLLKVIARFRSSAWGARRDRDQWRGV